LERSATRTCRAVSAAAPAQAGSWFGTMMDGGGGWILPVLALLVLVGVVLLVVWTIPRR